MPIPESTQYGRGIPGYIIVDDPQWLYFNRTNAALLAEPMEAAALSLGEAERAGMAARREIITPGFGDYVAMGTESRPPTRFTIPLKFIDFEAGISEEFGPQYDEYPTIGRHAPYLAYTGGSHREFKFSVLFIDEEAQGTAMAMARTLQSLTLPWRAETDVPRPQPEVLLSILPLNFLTVRGILKEVHKTETTPLLEKYKVGRSNLNKLGIGSVAVDLTFLTTEPLGDRTIFKYLNEGHMLYDDSASSSYPD